MAKVSRSLLVPALFLMVSAASAKTERVTFSVQGKADKASAAAKKVSGVSKADLKGSQLKVEYDTAKTTPQKIANGLAGAGATARLLLRVEGMH